MKKKTQKKPGRGGKRPGAGRPAGSGTKPPTRQIRVYEQDRDSLVGLAMYLGHTEGRPLSNPEVVQRLMEAGEPILRGSPGVYELEPVWVVVSNDGKWGKGFTPDSAFLEAGLGKFTKAKAQKVVLRKLPPGAIGVYVDEVGQICWSWLPGADRSQRTQRFEPWSLEPMDGVAVV